MEAGVEQYARCREVVHSSECPLSEVPLYNTAVAVCEDCHGEVSGADGSSPEFPHHNTHGNQVHMSF